MERLKAVLFDFGGVFMPSPFSALELFARERGLDPQLFSELVFGPYHLDTDHPWHRLERGEHSIEATREAILATSRSQGQEVDLWDVLIKIAQVNGGQMVYASMVELLREVKEAGYHTAIVTNNIREFSDTWQAMIPMDKVDVVVDSSFVGIRKPNPAIYQMAIDRLEYHHKVALRPENCVFLDDVDSNVKAAQTLGIRGIHVTPDPQETIQNLKALLSAGSL